MVSVLMIRFPNRLASMARDDEELIAALETRTTDLEEQLREITSEQREISGNLQRLEAYQNDIREELNARMDQGFDRLEKIIHNLAESCGKQIFVDTLVNHEKEGSTIETTVG